MSGVPVVGAAVVGATMVGATVVGAPVVDTQVSGVPVVGAAVVGATLVGATVVGAIYCTTSICGVYNGKCLVDHFLPDKMLVKVLAWSAEKMITFHNKVLKKVITLASTFSNFRKMPGKVIILSSILFKKVLVRVLALLSTLFAKWL